MNAELDRRSLLRAGAVVGGAGAVAIATGEVAEAGVRRSRPTVGFVVGSPTVARVGGAATVRVPVLTEGRQVLVETQPVGEVRAEQVAASVAAGMLVDFVVSGGRVVVPLDPSATFHTALRKESRRDRSVFVTQKYGPELARRDGRPGAMVAAGWVYAKDAKPSRSATGGSSPRTSAVVRFPTPSKRYEETYQVASDVEVYRVDIQDWAASVPSTFDAVPVTRDYAYSTTAPAGRVRRVRPQLPQARAGQGRSRSSTSRRRTPRTASRSGTCRRRVTLLADKGVDPVSGPAATSTSTRPVSRPRSVHP